MSVWDKSRDKPNEFNELFDVVCVLLGTGVGGGKGVWGNGCVGVCGGDLSMALCPLTGLGGDLGLPMVIWGSPSHHVVFLAEGA